MIPDIPLFYDDLKPFLKKNKYKKLGEGIHGMAWECEDGTVIKFFKRDSAYENFVKYCRRSRNPNVPVFLTPIKKIGDFYCVRMEKLTNAGRGKRHRIAAILRDEIDAAIELQAPIHGAKSTAKVFKDHPGLIKIVKWVQKSPWSTDMHTGNLLLRGDVPVVIDPVVCWSDG